MASTANAADPKGRQFFNRFKYQVDRLFNGSDKEKDTARQRLPLVATEAKAAGFGLPKPAQLGISNFDEGILTEVMGEAGADEALFYDVEATAPVEGATQTKADKKKAKLAEAKAVKAEQKASKPAKGAKRERKSTRPDGLLEGPCLDGCGRTVKGRFSPGHDAKLKSLIIKIERGEEAPESIPEVAQKMVKFKKGELMVTKDKEGKVTEKTQTYICTESPVKLPSHSVAEAAA